ncbi:uncharacterized protein LOC128212988 isoform X3 [Mya arenaria]|uniref:uncharacterized protein LOC128212988 isoform X3 n=1 Tax=Mya arenaria TaxID=6604 RepID=UPI0022E528FD|nr:uncharacterized protein LOC128212988 isoform X3 [Mya arenaria]
MYQADVVVNSRMAGMYRCRECHMNFQAQHLLSKHKQKFCVGSLSDPDDLQLRRGLRSTSPRRIISPADRKLRPKGNSVVKRTDYSPHLIKTLQTPEASNPHALSRLEMFFPTKPIESPDVPINFHRPLMETGDGMGSASAQPQGAEGGLAVGQERLILSPKSVEEKLHQLRQLKEKRSRNRDLRDLEERMLLDELGDTENRGSPRRTRSRIPLSTHKEIRDLQLEYEKLREKENQTGVRKSIPARFVPSREERTTPYTRNSNSSMSIYLDDEYRKNGNQDQQLRSLAENHGRQMEYLQLQNRDLEKQREDIRKRLEGLGRRTVAPPPQDNTADLLRELREQEIRNQRALDDLKRQLHDLHGNQKVNVIEIEKPVYHQPPPPPQPEPPKKSFVMPVYYGKSLVAEITAIRQAYLQNGGNDPDVLAQMSQMQAEAQAIEDQMNQKPPERPHKDKPRDNESTFKLLESENDRLIQELRLLQEQNILAKNRRNNDKEDELERELRRLQREHLEKMYGLQKELDDLRMMLLMERNRPPPPTTHVVQQPGPPVSLWREQTPWLFQKPYVEVEPMAPYDQYAGFVIFYDFVLSLDPTVQACRLVVGLHSSSAVMGEPTVLPTVYTEPATRGAGYNYNYSNAVIGAKQPVPKCPPEPDLGIVAELQASGGPASEHDRHSLITRAWTKIPLFDNDTRLLAGRYRIPMRNVPIKPFLHVSQVQRVPKYGDAELYYRIVNMRDAEIQSMQQISAANYNQYTHPQVEPVPERLPVYTPKRNIPPPPSASPLPTPRKKRPSAQSVPPSPQRLPSIQQRQLRSTSPPQIMALQDMTLGFQVDRVKKAESGEGKVRLTAYYASTGKVVQSTTSPVTCSTTAVRSNFKYGYHVFGQQEATFQEVEYQGDMVLIARFYLKKRQSDMMDEFMMPEQGGQEPTLYDEETCVAWAALPLVNCDQSLPLKKKKNFNPNTMSINQGTHTIPFYQLPMPEPNQIPLDGGPFPRDFARYGKATLRVYVFQGNPRPGSLTPSDVSDIEDEDTLPEFAWLPMERKTPPKDPFLLGDGFDVYIDGCRYLPDSATFTKVAGRILDRRYDLYGKDINTGVKLDSDVYNPVFEEKVEFRETNIPPTATLLLKVYTIDNFYKSLTVVGYSTINVFVETGTERQPNVDKPMQVSLNEGAHQLRLYAQGPNGVDPLSEPCLRDGGVRIVPCASLLIRLVKVARGAGGKALESSKVPQGDWLRMGLYQPRPKYSDRVYYSSKCMPTKGETRLFHSMMRRTRRTIREVIALVAPAKESFLRSDKNMEEFMRTQLTKTADTKPLDQDLNFVAQYSPKHGIKVAIDSAVSLPWTNFTHAHMCFNPPAAFYLGAPHATYDKLAFTEILDVRSTNTSPAWKDGFKHFPRRSYHRFMTLIIHLQEISVSVAKENYKYGLLEQAWTAVQIFTDKYCTTQAFQLPLFAGSPNQTILKQLAREPCKEWMERMIRNNGIQLLEGSSIFVRVADARRDDELLSDIAHNKLVEVNTDYIPVGLEEAYSRERPGKPIESLVPIGKTPEQFIDNLKVKFKSLVYKLYEEGNLEK